MRKGKGSVGVIIPVVVALLCWPLLSSDLTAQDDEAVDDLFSRAERRLISGRPDRAVLLYRQIAELDPYHPDAWYNLAELSRVQGLHADCLLYFQRLIFVLPSDAETVRPAVDECANALGGAGRLEISASAGEEETDVTVDGLQLGVAGLVLAPGEHTVRVEAYDYQPREARVVLEPNRLTTLEVTLEPVPHPATLRIVCDQAGASVTLEGQSLGETPFADPIGIQARQSYLVTIRKEGYYDWARRIEAEPFQELELDIVMTEYDPWAERFQ